MSRLYNNNNINIYSTVHSDIKIQGQFLSLNTPLIIILAMLTQLHNIYIYPYYYLQNNWVLFNRLIFLKYAV